MAAICVLPMHLTQFQQVTPYKKATVVNFPTGQDNLQTTLKTIEIACDLGADEIDYVFPYKDYLSGSKSSALAQAETVLNSCQRMNLLCKVILETGAFDCSHLYQLSCDLIQQGHDFLKTSTGRVTPGATPKAVFELLRAIKDTGSFCGIKISGGIKTVDDAQIYMSLATKVIGIPLNNKWFRLGASSLITSLLK